MTFLFDKLTNIWTPEYTLMLKKEMHKEENKLTKRTIKTTEGKYITTEGKYITTERKQDNQREI